MDIKINNIIQTLYYINGDRSSEKVSGPSYLENINLTNKLSKITKPLISQNERVFVLTTTNISDPIIFANLEDIPTIVSVYFYKITSYKEFWNGKLTRISKKSLNSMFEADNINFKIK